MVDSLVILGTVPVHFRFASEFPTFILSRYPEQYEYLRVRLDVIQRIVTASVSITQGVVVYGKTVPIKPALGVPFTSEVAIMQGFK